MSVAPIAMGCGAVPQVSGGQVEVVVMDQLVFMCARLTRSSDNFLAAPPFDDNCHHPMADNFDGSICCVGLERGKARNKPKERPSDRRESDDTQVNVCVADERMLSRVYCDSFFKDQEQSD